MPSPLELLTNTSWVARTLLGTGIVTPTRPDRAARLALAVARWGPTPAGGYAVGAIRHPDRPARVDERGSLTFAEVHRRTNALAHAFSAAGLGEGDRVAILCRNHRGWVEATVALSKLGAHALYLNTSFAGPQIADVCSREQAAAIVFDEEFRALVAPAVMGRDAFVAWFGDESRTDPGGGGRPAEPVLEDLIAGGDPSDLAPPAEKGRTVILTSGTTGTPKGATRAAPESVEPLAAILSKIPLRARETTMIAAPLFHSWGFAHWALGLALSSTVVLRRRFDPEDTLAACARHRASALVVVPVMLQRILELPPDVIARYDLTPLRTIPVSGSALPGELATRVMDAFGDTLYNLYGSTEVAWATIATPEDLRAAPGTAGRPPRGTTVRIHGLDSEDELPTGQTGRIFVGNPFLFEGYTGGGSKDEISGLMATGDVGHLDPAGRLFVDGRDDDMVVSGGENVFPAEVEDCIAKLPGVREVAVVGVPDEDFGQRLRAFVVGDVTEGAVRRAVRENLARYKVPRDVEFRGELPRNATGKVLKRELTEDADERSAERG